MSPNRGMVMNSVLIPMLLMFSASSSAFAADAQPLKCPLGAPYDLNNAFAKIISGEKRQAIVYSDHLLIAFVPISWNNPGHVLIVPRRHVRNLSDMNDAEMLAVFHLIRRIAAAQEHAFGSTGFTVEENNGRHQSVCHAHFHVIPNTPVEPVKNATTQEMEAVAGKLRAALAQS